MKENCGIKWRKNSGGVNWKCGETEQVDNWKNSIFSKCEIFYWWKHHFDLQSVDICSYSVAFNLTAWFSMEIALNSIVIKSWLLKEWASQTFSNIFVKFNLIFISPTCGNVWMKPYSSWHDSSRVLVESHIFFRFEHISCRWNELNCLHAAHTIHTNTHEMNIKRKTLPPLCLFFPHNSNISLDFSIKYTHISQIWIFNDIGKT